MVWLGSSIPPLTTTCTPAVLLFISLLPLSEILLVTADCCFAFDAGFESFVSSLFALSLLTCESFFLPLALSVLFFFLLLFLVFHKFFSRWQLESKAGRFFRFAFFLLRRFGWEKFLNARLFQLHCRAFVLFALFWRRRLWFFGFFWLFDCLFLALHLWPRLPRGLRLVVVHDLPSTALTENHRADARGSHVCRGSRRRPADHHLVFFSSIAFVGRVLDKHLSWLTHKGRHVIRLSLFHPHIIANSDSVNAGVGRFHLLYSNRLLCRIARTFVLFSLAPFKILCGVY
mmetsp:Transcript_5295/g.12598  ORF Transcript_5295/g.12598 Transcript_5295/m.12598 type:complete len:287 (-) Transcript_5295:3-863(-)